MKCCHRDMNLGNVRLLLMALLVLVPAGLRAAVFDFTPAVGGGVVSAQYVLATGNVELRVGAGNQYLKVVPTAGQVQQDPIVNKGIAAWASASTVYYYVFDPVTTNWIGATTPVSGFQFDLAVEDGVVSWSLAGTASFRVFDPLRRTWSSASQSGLGSGVQLVNRGGVVAGVREVSGSDYRVFTWTYDPLRSTPWVSQETQVGGSTTIQSENGIVAWNVPTGQQQFTVYYSVYDPKPAIRNWQRQSEVSAYFATLSLANSVVSWTPLSGGQVNRGYNGPASVWSDRSTPAAYFAASTNSGNAPFTVAFIDMSLGASSWSWNFGDGQGSSQRSPVHTYTTFLRTNVVLTASANTLSSSASQTIVTDIIPPTGTVLINGTTGGGFTTNRNVTLTLTATDNSPNPLTMRLSNEGTNWTDWMPFAATTPWALPTNVGTRSVSAQFRDGALNTSSPPATASIQLDTTPLPVAILGGTNLDETAGSVVLPVTLDHAYSRQVAISYFASNGTAIAGNDFAFAPGTLVFAPGERTKNIPVSIQEDGLVEINETFSIHLTVVSNAIVGAPATVTILDNDPPLVSFVQTNYPVLENDTNGAVVLLRLSAPSGRLVTLGYVATNGTATPNVDFTSKQGVIVFQPGQIESGFVIPLNNDSLDEYPEVINVRLLGATNAIISGVADVTVTIVDDDLPLVSFTQSVIPALEPPGNSGAGVVQVDVRLSKPFTNQVTVRISVEGISATPGPDYLPPSTDTLFFNPGDTNAALSLVLWADAAREPQETIRLRLVSFFNASPGGILSADVVITDEDAPPFMSGPVVSTNGQFTATFTGYPGQVFAVECSPNFTTWTEIVRLTNTTGTLVFSQTFSTNAVGQFYRTRLIP